MGLPKKIKIHEVGPREGMQFEKKLHPLQQKVDLINHLAETGINQIEVTSFVHPKWVPQMSDAEQVVELLPKRQDISYDCVYLNIKGLDRALATQKLTVEGKVYVTATNTFSKKNTNKDIDQTIADLPKWIDAFKEREVPIKTAGIMAAFGCNYEGDVSLAHVISLIQKIIELENQFGFKFKEIQLADTMGWANPEQIKRTVATVKDKWPDKSINLHLHDTRGLGMINVYTAMQEGIDNFDSAIGGLGGCPFAGFSSAAGNVCTEDIVFLCHELGIDTGIDLDKLIACAQEAEALVHHPLPGKVMKGGSLHSLRKREIING